MLLCGLFCDSRRLLESLKISPMICEEAAEGRGLFCHSQSSGNADWWESRWAGLYWPGTGSGRSHCHCRPSENLKEKMNANI